MSFSLRKDVYTPKGFFHHAASLHQTFVHCGRFLTAASRRSVDSVSVPLRQVALSRLLPVIALVGRYPANKLIGHRLLFRCLLGFHPPTCVEGLYRLLAPVSRGYGRP